MIQFAQKLKEFFKIQLTLYFPFNGRGVEVLNGNFHSFNFFSTLMASHREQHGCECWVFPVQLRGAGRAPPECRCDTLEQLLGSSVRLLPSPGNQQYSSSEKNKAKCLSDVVENPCHFYFDSAYRVGELGK